MYINTQQPGTDVKGPFEKDPELSDLNGKEIEKRGDISIHIADHFTVQEKLTQHYFNKN